MKLTNIIGLLKDEFFVEDLHEQYVCSDTEKELLLKYGNYEVLQIKDYDGTIFIKINK